MDKSIIKHARNTITEQLFLLRDIGVLSQQNLVEINDKVYLSIMQTKSHPVTGDTTPEQASTLLFEGVKFADDKLMEKIGNSRVCGDE